MGKVNTVMGFIFVGSLMAPLLSHYTVECSITYLPVKKTKRRDTQWISKSNR